MNPQKTKAWCELLLLNFCHGYTGRCMILCCFEPSVCLPAKKTEKEGIFVKFTELTVFILNKFLSSLGHVFLQHSVSVRITLVVARF